MNDETNRLPAVDLDQTNGRIPEAVDAAMPAVRLDGLASSLQDALDGLQQMVENPVPPKIAELGAGAVRVAFEKVASDVESIATDHVQRALALQQELHDYASVLRRAGADLTSRVELETTKAFHISKTVMRVRELVGQGAGNRA